MLAGRLPIAAPLLVAELLLAVASPLAPRLLHGQEGESLPLKLPLKLAPRPTTTAVTADDLMTRLYQFADDSMGGRATGSVGHLISTAYLAADVARLGLVPAGDAGSYFQVLPLMARRIATGSTARVRQQRFEVGLDFGAVITEVPGGWLPDSVEVVYGGVLDDTLTQISAEQAAGKLVLLDPGARSLRLSPQAYRVSRGSRFATAVAVAVPVWETIASSAQRDVLAPLLESPVPVPADGRAPHPPTLLVTREFAAALRQVADSGAPGERVGLDLALRETPVARNVVAILPGSDSLLRGEYIALGAHSDHDGIREASIPVSISPTIKTNPRRLDMPRPRVVSRAPSPSASRSDTVMNGADDDGSGTVALLEIAEELAARPVAPRRSILFVWHAAEEQGMVGSEWFTANPTVPIEAILAQVNLDMVGRGGRRDIEDGGPRYLQVVGSRRRSTELGEIVDSVNAVRTSPFKFDYRLDASSHPERIFCRSDHASYARFGIPVVFFSTGLHPDYHQPSDEPQHIDYTKLTAVSEYVRDLVLTLADRDAPLTLDRRKPDPRATCRP